MIKQNKILSIALLLCVSASHLYAGKDDNKAELTVIRSGLSDADREIRIASIDALAAVGDKDSIPALKALLEDKNDPVRIKAAVALHKLGDNSGIGEVRRILKTRAALSDNPTPLERAKAIARGTVRVAAAKALGDMRDEGSTALLKEMFDDPDGRVEDACLVALGKLGNPSAKDDFISALQSTKQEVRAKSIEALAEIGDPVCIPAIRKRLKDWNRDAKAAAIAALGKLKDKESSTAMREFLLDNDEIIRENAAISLGLIGDAEETTVTALKKILEDPNGTVRLAAVDALNSLGDDSGKDFLLRVLRSSDRDAKLKALAIFERAAKPKDITALKKMLEDTDKHVAIAAARAIVSGTRRNNKN